MVGGTLIEIRPMRVLAGPTPGREVDVVQLWCVGDRHEPYDECAVFAEPAEIMPKVGDQIWWQCGKVYFDRDQHTLRKVGYSFEPRPAARPIGGPEQPGTDGGRDA